MKTTSQSAERLTFPRKFGILDKLVLMLAVSLFVAWILGTLYLSFFSSDASANANSQTAALIDGDGDNSSAGLAATDSESSDDGTRSVTDAGDPNQSQATGDLPSEEKTALEQKISTLQEQLETKSQELTQLRKTSEKSADSKPKEAANTAKYKNEISQLTKQKDRLDREIKKLKDLSKTQKTKIQTLQDQLVAVADTNPVTAEASEMDPALSGTPPRNQPLEFRDWISSKGNKARLAFVRWEGDEIVVVNEANKEFRLALNRLSPIDQKYVNSKR